MAAVWNRAGDGGVDRAEAEARLAAARTAGDLYAESSALVELVEVAYRRWDAQALISDGERAWEHAERNHFWDQLARLAMVFGGVADRAGDFQQCFDHFANACAYAGMAGPTHFQAAVTRCDELVLGMLADGRSALAAAFCDMLVDYEAAGGLGQADPGFAAHFRDLRQRFQPEVWADPSRAAA